MAGLSTSPRLVQLFYALLLLGIVPLTIGFATEYWSHDIYANIGLWGMCHVSFGCEKTSYTTGYFEATQVLETIALVLAYVGLLMTTLYIFTEQTSGSRVIYILGMVFVLLSANASILGGIVYGSKSPLPLSWSYVLCVIGGILYGISGVMMVVRLLRSC